MNIHRSPPLLLCAGLVFGGREHSESVFRSRGRGVSVESHSDRRADCAKTRRSDIISRVVATELSDTEGLAGHHRKQAGRGDDDRRHRGPQAAGDGYSLYALSVPVTAAPAFLPNMPFRLDADFAPVIRFQPP